MRKYITASEWDCFFEAIADSTNAVRDRAMFQVAYRHGLRVSELTGLKVGDLDMFGKSLYVRRLKNGLSTVHPVQSDTLHLLRSWLKIRGEYLCGLRECEWLFLSQEGGSLSRQRVFRLARRYGERAGLPFAFHPHMLRHACGYALADQGLDTRLIQDYLGHKNISHTVRYTAGNVSRFCRVWQ
ncbi:TPA: tyrosine-type recombinase/integrase [Salmonella enterica subsp. enterica serovar Muenchen]|nr:tyrosine-type recombinase/integrase [Salmonella enterica subsp. enterica serovar Muenchen]HEC8861197.1 tyrosine-type recombinase/integrase [Salmonella enterica subsp. enterica serovar Muenchen]